MNWALQILFIAIGVYVGYLVGKSRRRKK